MEIESSVSFSKGVPEMRYRFWVRPVALLGAALALLAHPSAQTRSTPRWPDPVPNRRPVAEKDKKPAPRRSLVGMWGARAGNRQSTNQSSGVQLMPNNGKQENQRPFS